MNFDPNSYPAYSDPEHEYGRRQREMLASALLSRDAAPPAPPPRQGMMRSYQPAPQPVLDGWAVAANAVQVAAENLTRHYARRQRSTGATFPTGLSGNPPPAAAPSPFGQSWDGGFGGFFGSSAKMPE